MYRSNWFGFDEWKGLGLTISSTSSVEAVKLYDAAVTQSFALYDDPVLGGLTNTLTKLSQTDPDFVLGNAFTLGSQLLGFVDSYYNNEDIKQRTDALLDLANRKRDQITQRELKHVQAVVQMSQMQWSAAADIWEDILRQSPTDVHAIKMSFFMRFYTGQRDKQFDLVERAYPHFQTNNVLHADLMHAYYGFVLQECGRYSEAEKYARLALHRNEWDGWATHTMAHIYEMSGRFEEGLQFMSSRSKLWTRANHLACHNYWHHSLFNLAIGDFDGAIAVLDEQMLPRMKATETAFSIFDSSSLLYRLLFVDQQNRSFGDELIVSKYRDVFAVAKQYLSRHVLGFTNTHLMMTCLGSSHRAEAFELLEQLSSSKLAELHPEVASVTAQLLNGMIDYEQGNYERATDTLNSVKDSVYLLGGSNAQRDVFSQLLLVCAVKSDKQSHKKLAQDLLEQRKVFEMNDKFLTGKVNRS